MKGQRQIGNASERQHHDKLIRDYNNLPKDIQVSVDDIIKERKKQNYIPHPLLQTPFTLFWRLRSTKPYESPITHIDIKAILELYQIQCQIWEIETILAFDGQYYISSQQN